MDEFTAWIVSVEKRLAALEKQDQEARTMTGYMCKTDFFYELGQASNGEKIYATVEDLKKGRPCVETCGIVEVEVRLVRVLDEGVI